MSMGLERPRGLANSQQSQFTKFTLILYQMTREILPSDRRDYISNFRSSINKEDKIGTGFCLLNLLNCAETLPTQCNAFLRSCGYN